MKRINRAVASSSIPEHIPYKNTAQKLAYFYRFFPQQIAENNKALSKIEFLGFQNRKSE